MLWPPLDERAAATPVLPCGEKRQDFPMAASPLRIANKLSVLETEIKAGGGNLKENSPSIKVVRF